MKSPNYLDKNKIGASFSQAAASYDHVAVLQREVGQRIMGRLTYIKIAPEIIVDLGAGTGYCSRLLEKNYRKSSVYVIDLAQNMLVQAKKQSSWLTRQRFIQADMSCLPLADHSVDFIFSNMVLHWCGDLHQVFNELRRVLRPNGLLMFSTLGPDTLKELRASWQQVDNYSHVNAFIDMHDVGDALLKAQFADPVLDMEYFSLTYPDVFLLMQELKRLGAHNLNYGRKLGLTGKQQLHAMMSAYEQFRDSQGQLPATYEVIYGHAWAPAITKSQDIQVPLSTIKRREHA